MKKSIKKLGASQEKRKMVHPDTGDMLESIANLRIVNYLKIIEDVMNYCYE